MRSECLQRLLQRCRFQQVVWVTHGQGLPAAWRRCADVWRAGARQAALSAAFYAGPRAIEIGEKAGGRAIRGAVVDDNDIEVLDRLREQAVQRLVEIGAQVVARDDERGRGHGHGVAVSDSPAPGGDIRYLALGDQLVVVEQQRLIAERRNGPGRG